MSIECMMIDHYADGAVSRDASLCRDYVIAFTRGSRIGLLKADAELRKGESFGYLLNAAEETVATKLGISKRHFNKYENEIKIWRVVASTLDKALLRTAPSRPPTREGSPTAHIPRDIFAWANKELSTFYYDEEPFQF